MSFLDFVKKQFIDILQWTEDAADGGDTLVWRYPMQDMEIQNGGSLTVRESQMAVFVDQGKIADVFGPGTYRLTTQTLPVLTYLRNWDKLFESPFKSDVYFFSTRQRLDRKWGTPNPITLRDQDFGMVRLRAFGIYAYHLSDPKRFHQTISGTVERYSTESLEGQLRNTVVGAISDLFAGSGVPFIDMAANQDAFSKALKAKLDPAFEQYGLALDSFVVQNVSLPEELQKMLDARIGVNMLGGMQGFTQYQVASSIPLAAQNEGGLAGLGAGVGVGLGVGQQITQSVAQALSPAQPATAASGTVGADEVVATLEKLHGLAEKGIITREDFEAKKTELLKKLS